MTTPKKTIINLGLFICASLSTACDNAEQRPTKPSVSAPNNALQAEVASLPAIEDVNARLLASGQRVYLGKLSDIKENSDGRLDGLFGEDLQATLEIETQKANQTLEAELETDYELGIVINARGEVYLDKSLPETLTEDTLPGDDDSFYMVNENDPESIEEFSSSAQDGDEYLRLIPDERWRRKKPGKKPWRSIGRLRMQKDADPELDSSCTATKVGDRILVTAAHCFIDMYSKRFSIPASFSASPNGIDKKGKDIDSNGVFGMTAEYWVPRKWVTKSGKILSSVQRGTHDFALVVMKDSKKLERLGYWPVSARSDNGSKIYTCGYPGDNNVTCPERKHGCGGFMWCDSGQVRWAFNNSFTSTSIYIDFGQSGSPIYMKEEKGDESIRRVAGVVAFWDREAPRTRKAYASRINQWRLEKIQALRKEYPSKY